MINSQLQSKSNKNYLIIICLILSFVWISLYPVANALTGTFYFSYGNILDVSSSLFSNFIIYTIISAVVSWIGFELIFMLYRFLLAFKIYSFVLSPEKLKNELRLYFIYRNIIYGLFMNLCFIYPYLYSLVTFVDVIVTMTTFICFSTHIKSTYSEPLVGHFVFKCFINPVILYEIFVVTINFLEVI